MIQQQAIETPIEGKTYSLYGPTAGTANYYTQVAELANVCLQECSDIRQLLAAIHNMSEKKGRLKRLVKRPDASLASFVLHTSKEMLSAYTKGVEAHLRDASILHGGDPTLLTTEEQYHLYMLEIELANRFFRADFAQCEVKLAFLPHCLRDLDKACQAVHKDIDYICKGCSKKCFINRVSQQLRSKGIQPYIWMDADLKSLFRSIKTRGNSLGVLGIACVPELVEGTRLCMRADIPVVGVPLNANRCARWMGQFHNTSVDLNALESLFQIR